ncbi:MAG: phosphate/phosphite/phosphonate ABC transporter substrate-binding protein [Planctomycetota bacterium]
MTHTLRRALRALLTLLFPLALGLPSAGCSDPAVGTEARPFTMYFVPSADTEKIAASAKDIQAFVATYVSRALYNSDTGFHVETAIPTSYVAVVEAFGTGRADFAALNTFGYVLAKDVKKYPVEAILTVVRGNGETSYRGQIITHVDSGINTLADLAGRKFAYTDAASTAGYILPSKLLRDRGVQLGETVFSGKHDSVVMQVYQRAVDAGATFYSPPTVVTAADGTTSETPRDARARVLTQYPDVFEKVKIIDFTADTPNDAWVVRQGLDPDAAKDAAIRNAVRDALLAFAATPEGAESLEGLYDITGLAPADDARYDGIRKLVLESGLDLESNVK